MKNAICFCFSLVLSVTLQAAEVFEGTYDMKIKADGETFSISLATKDSHVRMSVKGQEMPGEMIMRDGMKTMLMVMPQQKMYMEMPLQGMAETYGGGGSSEGDSGSMDEMPFKKTGETKEIDGYKAHEFVFEDEDGKMHIWATEELGAMPFVGGPMMEKSSIPMKRLTGLSSFFPLETIGYEKGKKKFEMTVTNIEKKELPDSLFLPPPGFRKMTMPAGMGGFMGR